MDNCDTFVREKHIQYILDVGNETNTLAAVSYRLHDLSLDCYRTSPNEWSVLGIMCIRNSECGRPNEQRGTCFLGFKMPE